MVREVTKAMARRGYDSRYAVRWFVGDAIDIGAGNDSLDSHRRHFPLLKSVRSWDLADGDAMLMEGIPDESYDVVHSSHCLEHLDDPYLGIQNWLRICRRGGHLILVVPDEDLYEQGVFPSTFNADHKWTFTINKNSSWSSNSINLFRLLDRFSDKVRVFKIELLDTNFRYDLGRMDQTWDYSSESAIEVILQRI